MGYIEYTPKELLSLTLPNLNFPLMEDTIYLDNEPITLILNQSNEDEDENKDENYDISKSIELLFADNGIAIKVCSAFRPGAKTKQGRKSNHSKKDQYGRSLAYDIKPLDGDWNKLRIAMVLNEEIRNYFKERGIGVIDETIPKNMRKTGATGKHFHIGPDTWARNTWNDWLTLYAQKGCKLIPRAKGGYLFSPSSNLLGRINNWEGSSMRTNASHKAEAKYWNSISPNLDKLNDIQRDSLYDYLYNATPSYRKYVVPVLRDFDGNYEQWYNKIREALKTAPRKGGLRSRADWRVTNWDDGTTMPPPTSDLNPLRTPDPSTLFTPNFKEMKPDPFWEDAINTNYLNSIKYE